MNKLGTIGKILQIKEWREEEIEVEVRKLRDAVSAHESRIGSLESAYLDTLDSFNRKQGDGSLRPNEMGIYYSYFYHLQKEMDAMKADLARILAALDIRQNDLVEAHKETRVVETLKDRRTRERAKEESQRERKEMDFLSSTKRRDR
ncbi:MAG: flagellar export protein FliJ [Deltaproteobacteria bacterium]|nr:flagellar export protein FliJ [Deltaproteobacteria bacterium]